MRMLSPKVSEMDGLLKAIRKTDVDELRLRLQEHLSIKRKGW